MLFQTMTEEIHIAKAMPSQFPLHSHHHIEIVICSEGSARVSCNNVEKVLLPGDAMLVFPNDLHSFIDCKNSRGTMMIINPDLSERLTATWENGRYENFVSCPGVLPVIKELHKKSNLQNTFVTYGYIHVILGMLLKQIADTDAKMEFPVFDTAIRYISAHYTEPLSLRTLSTVVGVSEAHLSRLFSERVEGGFQHYLQILRVEKAKALLISSNRTISEIIFESGFSDQRTFNRVFKSILSVTPREYRKQNRQ